MRAATLAVSALCLAAGTMSASASVVEKLTQVLSEPGPLGWSADGHQATAYIASKFLTDNAAAAVNSIISPDTMEYVATWADDVKNEAAWKWSKPLHFINTPDWACKFQPSDCANDFCLYSAILNYTQQMATGGTEQYYATKFIIHFMGDIHQPLHVGFKSDNGGNDYQGTFLGASSSLHMVWDNGIIQQRLNDFSGTLDSYAAYLVTQLKGAWKSKIAAWTACMTPDSSACVVDWASDTAALACQYAYKDQNGQDITSGFDLGMDYYNFAVPIVDEQLAKGGIRLAYLLNAVFANAPSGSSSAGDATA